MRIEVALEARDGVGEGPFWDDIARTSSIALYLPLDADWKGTSLALYAVEPSRLQ